jgi:hypothetical protein
MLQIVLLATGVVLIVNGWSLLSGAQVPGTTALNLLLGVLDIAFAVSYAVTGDYYGALKVALFGITYAWYALNLLLGVTNHQTLGWYCFAVVVAAVPIAVDTFRVACQRDGTTSLPRAWDHLEVSVSISGPVRGVNGDAPGALVSLAV